MVGLRGGVAHAMYWLAKLHTVQQGAHNAHAPWHRLWSHLGHAKRGNVEWCPPKNPKEEGSWCFVEGLDQHRPSTWQPAMHLSSPHPHRPCMHCLRHAQLHGGAKADSLVPHDWKVCNAAKSHYNLAWAHVCSLQIGTPRCKRQQINPRPRAKGVVDAAVAMQWKNTVQHHGQIASMHG